MVELALRGRGVLVVEGEYLIAMMLRDHLEAAGLIVIGPVSSVADAGRLIEANRKIELGILDVNLGGGVMSYRIADALLARSIPFIFTSGYEPEALSTRYPNVPYCQKPYQFPELERVLTSALSPQA
jgi:CheY-like chemotaxis protein